MHGKRGPGPPGRRPPGRLLVIAVPKTGRAIPVSFRSSPNSLDRGRVVEQGNHDRLIANAGVYADLYTLQASAYDPDVQHQS